ncbi:helix-turn-helix transcriptional regulator [Sanguibacter sp. HDW7]|uniref:helix-turn-helix transcriptional regulator n=1 Tax=Sanguibacter sp. HDW7 TaxID=2714931 RepID=UPI00140B9D23|nr:helix-turn-helix domain-containing protein [Sanguibacter sp. HDW7]QIK83386.1 helix-turn-helix domain-containing protein [Sanguibacter sp. HDW7]
MDLDEKQIGHRLRARRLRAGLTQSELADRASVSLRALSDLENGNGSSLRVALAAARPLGGLSLVLATEPVAAHRRAARLPSARSTSPRREDRKSFELHRSIVRKLRADPDEVTRRAAAGVSRLLSSPHLGPQGRRWVQEWAEAVESGPEVLERLSLRDDEHGASLRQVSPFFGVLSTEERLASLRRA